jgi:hypothetical protein
MRFHRADRQTPHAMVADYLSTGNVPALKVTSNDEIGAQTDVGSMEITPLPTL